MILNKLVGPLYEANTKRQMTRRLLNTMCIENTAVLPGQQKMVEYPYAWIRTPGTSAYVTTNGTEVRAMKTHRGSLYVVSGNKLQSVAKDKTVTTLGTLNTKVGLVQIIAGYDELLILDSTNGYSYIPSTGDFATITDENFPSLTVSGTIYRGYFLVVDPDTHSVYVSDLNDARSWSALEVISKTSDGDNLLAVKQHKSYIWMFGETSTEVLALGAAGFAPVSGVLIEYGIAAINSIVVASDLVYWVGRNETGKALIVRAEGFNPSIKSTRPLNIVLDDIQNPSDCVAWTLTCKGNELIYFNFPTDKKTYVWNGSTGLFHQEDYLINGEQSEHHIGRCSAVFNNKLLIGSRLEGKLLEYGFDYFTHNGTRIRRLGISDHAEYQRKIIGGTSLEIIADQGTAQTSGQGSAPIFELRVSVDFGNNWDPPILISAGALGDYDARMVVNRLGSARQFTFELSTTDPVEWMILGMALDVEVEPV